MDFLRSILCNNVKYLIVAMFYVIEVLCFIYDLLFVRAITEFSNTSKKTYEYNLKNGILCPEGTSCSEIRYSKDVNNDCFLNQLLLNKENVKQFNINNSQSSEQIVTHRNTVQLKNEANVSSLKYYSNFIFSDNNNKEKMEVKSSKVMKERQSSCQLNHPSENTVYNTKNNDDFKSNKEYNSGFITNQLILCSRCGMFQSVEVTTEASQENPEIECGCQKIKKDNMTCKVTQYDVFERIEDSSVDQCKISAIVDKPLKLNHENRCRDDAIKESKIELKDVLRNRVLQQFVCSGQKSIKNGMLQAQNKEKNNDKNIGSRTLQNLFTKNPDRKSDIKEYDLPVFSNSQASLLHKRVAYNLNQDESSPECKKICRRQLTRFQSFEAKRKFKSKRILGKHISKLNVLTTSKLTVKNLMDFRRESSLKRNTISVSATTIFPSKHNHCLRNEFLPFAKHFKLPNSVKVYRSSSSPSLITSNYEVKKDSVWFTPDRTYFGEVFKEEKIDTENVLSCNPFSTGIITEGSCNKSNFAENINDCTVSSGKISTQVLSLLIPNKKHFTDCFGCRRKEEFNSCSYISLNENEDVLNVSKQGKKRKLPRMQYSIVLTSDSNLLIKSKINVIETNFYKPVSLIKEKTLETHAVSPARPLNKKFVWNRNVYESVVKQKGMCKSSKLPMSVPYKDFKSKLNPNEHGVGKVDVKFQDHSIPFQIAPSKTHKFTFCPREIESVFKNISYKHKIGQITNEGDVKIIEPDDISKKPSPVTSGTLIFPPEFNNNQNEIAEKYHQDNSHHQISLQTQNVFQQDDLNKNENNLKRESSHESSLNQHHAPLSPQSVFNKSINETRIMIDGFIPVNSQEIPSLVTPIPFPRKKRNETNQIGETSVQEHSSHHSMLSEIIETSVNTFIYSQQGLNTKANETGYSKKLCSQEPTCYQPISFITPHPNFKQCANEGIVGILASKPGGSLEEPLCLTQGSNTYPQVGPVNKQNEMAFGKETHMQADSPKLLQTTTQLVFSKSKNECVVEVNGNKQEGSLEAPTKLTSDFHHQYGLNENVNETRCIVDATLQEGIYQCSLQSTVPPAINSSRGNENSTKIPGFIPVGSLEATPSPLYRNPYSLSNNQKNANHGEQTNLHEYTSITSLREIKIDSCNKETTGYGTEVSGLLETPLSIPDYSHPQCMYNNSTHEYSCRRERNNRGNLSHLPYQETTPPVSNQCAKESDLKAVSYATDKSLNAPSTSVQMTHLFPQYKFNETQNDVVLKENFGYKQNLSRQFPPSCSQPLSNQNANEHGVSVVGFHAEKSLEAPLPSVPTPQTLIQYWFDKNQNVDSKGDSNYEKSSTYQLYAPQPISSQNVYKIIDKGSDFGQEIPVNLISPLQPLQPVQYGLGQYSFNRNQNETSIGDRTNFQESPIKNENYLLNEWEFLGRNTPLIHQNVDEIGYNYESRLLDNKNWQQNLSNSIPKEKLPTTKHPVYKSPWGKGVRCSRPKNRQRASRLAPSESSTSLSSHTQSEEDERRRVARLIHLRTLEENTEATATIFPHQQRIAGVCGTSKIFSHQKLNSEEDYSPITFTNNQPSTRLFNTLTPFSHHQSGPQVHSLSVNSLMLPQQSNPPVGSHVLPNYKKNYSTTQPSCTGFYASAVDSKMRNQQQVNPKEFETPVINPQTISCEELNTEGVDRSTCNRKMISQLQSTVNQFVTPADNNLQDGLTYQYPLPMADPTINSGRNESMFSHQSASPGSSIAGDGSLKSKVYKIDFSKKLKQNGNDFKFASYQPQNIIRPHNHPLLQPLSQQYKPRTIPLCEELLPSYQQIPVPLPHLEISQHNTDETGVQKVYSYDNTVEEMKDQYSPMRRETNGPIMANASSNLNQTENNKDIFPIREITNCKMDNSLHAQINMEHIPAQKIPPVNSFQSSSFRSTSMFGRYPNEDADSDEEFIIDSDFDDEKVEGYKFMAERVNYIKTSAIPNDLEKPHEGKFPNVCLESDVELIYRTSNTKFGKSENETISEEIMTPVVSESILNKNLEYIKVLDINSGHFGDDSNIFHYPDSLLASVSRSVNDNLSEMEDDNECDAVLESIKKELGCKKINSDNKLCSKSFNLSRTKSILKINKLNGNSALYPIAETPVPSDRSYKNVTD